MPISGNWLQKVRYPEPQYSKVHTSDPAHMEWGSTEQTDPHPDKAPSYQDTGSAPPPGYGAVTNAGGLVLDRTPWTGPEAHVLGGVPGPPPAVTGLHAQAVNQARSSSAHQQDLGATEVIGRDAPLTQFSDESYATISSRGFNANASRRPEIVLRRGMDGQPENSPTSPSYDGERFRLAYYYRWSAERDFKPQRRVHTYRWVSPQLAAGPQDATVPNPAGPYNSPFDSLSRAILTWHDTPMLRRVPEPVDESMTTDGLGDAYQPSLVDF